MPNEKSLGSADVLGFKFIQENLITKMRSALGRYQSIQQGKISDAHREMAEQVRKEQLKALQKQIEAHRRGGVQRETHYLVEAMKGDDYVQASKEGFVVNPEGYLDESQARLYWRNLETGTSKHIGQGIWFFRTDGFQNTPHAAIRDTELIGTHGKDDVLPGMATIKEAIPPYEYLDRGVETWKFNVNPIDVYRKNGIPVTAGK